MLKNNIQQKTDLDDQIETVREKVNETLDLLFNREDGDVFDAVQNILCINELLKVYVGLNCDVEHFEKFLSEASSKLSGAKPISQLSLVK